MTHKRRTHWIPSTARIKSQRQAIFTTQLWFEQINISKCLHQAFFRHFEKNSGSKKNSGSPKKLRVLSIFIKTQVENRDYWLALLNKAKKNPQGPAKKTHNVAIMCQWARISYVRTFASFLYNRVLSNPVQICSFLCNMVLACSADVVILFISTLYQINKGQNHQK